MNKVKLTGMVVVSMVMLFSIATAKGASLGSKAEDKVPQAEKTAKQSGVIQLKGQLKEKIEGQYDLVVEIFENQIQTELLSSKEFKAVEVKEGYYELPLNIEDFGLEIGTEYWLKISVNADIPDTLAQLKILPSQMIEPSSGGEGPVITTQYKIEGSYPAGSPNNYVLWVKNLSDGYGLRAESTGGTAVYAITSGTGTAVVAENPSGTAISANGDVAVTGDLNVTGQTNLTGGDLTLGGKLTVSGTGDSSFAGRLGIGDTTPAAKFTVGPNSEFRITATGEVRNIDGKETAPAYSFVGGGGNTGMWRTGTNTLAFSTAGLNRMTLTDTGLDVVGNVKGAGLCIGIDCRTQWPQTGIGGSGTANYIPKFTAATTIGNSNIFDNGNVGIGDSSPASLLTVGNGDKFQVTGTGIVLASSGTAAAPVYSFIYGQSSGMHLLGTQGLGFSVLGVDRLTIEANGQIVSLGEFRGNNGIIGCSGGTCSSLRSGVGGRNILAGLTTFSNSQGIEHGAWQEDGDVGIGTVNPSHKLEVIGTIKSTGLTVTGGTICLGTGC